MLKNKLFQKIAAIVLLSLLLLVPLSLIESQIVSRSARQAEVTRNLAESAAGAQTLVGPVLAIRYREQVARSTGDSGQLRYEIVERTRIIAPQKLIVDGEIDTEERRRGLYRARLFHLGARLSGNIAVPDRFGLDGTQRILDAQAFLVLGIADPRGVDNDPEASVNGRAVRFATGTGGFIAGQGAHVALGAIDIAGGQQFDFSIPLALTGSERLAIAPTAAATHVSLRANWPHPSFQGRFLPGSRTVTESGFEARWQVSHLARDLDRALAAAGPNAAHGTQEALAVSFVDPVNVYLKAERAVKYGVLFVVLTFAAFFLTEILRRLPIHPMQYLLVGLALAIFFLLLIALTEHLPFLTAYALSAGACVLLIGIYIAGALGGRLRGAAFGAGIASLYGVLYGVLASEDNALLMGTLLLFVALGVMMLATRRLDWYRIGGRLATAEQ